MKFEELELNEHLQKGILDAGFVDCMPVQEQTFQYTLIGRDVSVQSQTGTGKTAAFLISIFQRMLDSETRPKALIIVPTRELADQIEKEALMLGKHLDISIGSFYGGVGYHTQEELLRNNVDVMIGTPGRLMDLAQKRKLDFKKVGMLVIDEADRLFDMGFLPDIRKMLRKMPPYNKRMSMLFSATLNYTARDLAWEYMNDPKEIEIEPETVTVEAIEQKIYHVSIDEKMSLMLGILKQENAQNCIIFTNTKQAAVEVAHRMECNGYSCKYLIGDLPQKKRLKVIEDVKTGKIPFLVATDVAARGLHVDDLELVINYDVPQDCENYVHRIGRTARAGKKGKAVMLGCEKYVEGLEAIERYTHTKIPVAWAEEELYVEDKSAGRNFRSAGRAHSKTRRGKPSTRPDVSGSRHGRKGDSHRRKSAGPKSSSAPKKSPAQMSDAERRAHYAAKYGDKF